MPGTLNWTRELQHRHAKKRFRNILMNSRQVSNLMFTYDAGFKNSMHYPIVCLFYANVLVSGYLCDMHVCSRWFEPTCSRCVDLGRLEF